MSLFGSALPFTSRCRPITWPRVAALIVTALLAGCADRPGPETLVPVANPGPGEMQVTLLAVTNRTAAPTTPPTLGDGRGSPSYEQFTLQRRAEIEAPQEAPSKSFVTVARRLMAERAFEAELGRMAGSGDRPITIFVHGYNNSYQEAVFRLAQLSAVSSDHAVPVLFSWPSEGRTTGYLADKDAATYARDDLARLLTQVTRQHPNRDIAVVGHSMGAWLLMETLRQLRFEGKNKVVNSLSVVLASPDIDLDVFRKQIDVVGRLPTPLTVLVAADDRALAASGRLSGNRKRLGQTALNDPEIVAIGQGTGLRMMDISAAPTLGPMNHDRFISAAAQWSQLSQAGQPDDLRQTGAYILNSTGQILSAPFSAAARVLGGQ